MIGVAWQFSYSSLPERLQFTTSVGNDPPWNRYGVRFYLNAVWAQPQFSGSNSDARPVYQAVGRPFNVNDVLAEVHNIFPADEAHTTHIQLGDISTLASFVLYIIGILSSISVLPILCLVNANFSPQYTPSSRTKARLQTGIVALSALGTALGLAASISLTAQARNAVKALNSPVNSETTGDASVGSVFLGLTWGLVAAQIVNTVLLATQFVSEQRSW
jgi:hypothetical protein